MDGIDSSKLEMPNATSSQKLETSKISPSLLQKMSAFGHEIVQKHRRSRATSYIANPTVHLKEGLFQDSLETRKSTLQFDFKDSSGTKHGTESTVRIPYVLSEGKAGNKHYLLQKGEKLLRENENRDWISSTFMRSKMSKICIADAVLTEPVNLRYQKLDVGDMTQCGFCRLGIISDFRNGFTNLQELKQLTPETAKKKIQELEKIRSSYKEGSKKYESVDFAIHQLKNIANTIEERRYILQQQMLKLVQAQVQENAGTIQNGIMQLTHLALLNPKTSSLDSSGLMHDEKNEMLDMKEIFSECKDKQIFFDATHEAYVDKEGNMHLAKEKKGRLPDGIRIKPTFINISVQGHTKNDEVQAEINKEAIGSLEEVFQQLDEEGKGRLQEEFNSIKNALSNGRSDYRLAEDISVFLLKLKQTVSMGCFSAKDRTGYVGFRTCVRFLQESIQSKTELSHQKKKRLSKHFGGMAMKQSGIAVRVVEENTKEKLLKVAPFTLPGYTNTLIGKISRVGLFFRAGGLLIKEKVIKKLSK